MGACGRLGPVAKLQLLVAVLQHQAHNLLVRVPAAAEVVGGPRGRLCRSGATGAAATASSSSLTPGIEYEASRGALWILQTEASNAFMATAVIQRGGCIGQAIVVAVTANKAHFVRLPASSSASCAELATSVMNLLMLTMSSMAVSWARLSVKLFRTDRWTFCVS